MTGLTILLCLVTGVAHAGAWTQKEGEALLITNFSYYSASEFFDNSGRKQPLTDYSKYELNPYLEYGLRDDVTVGANIFVDRASQNSSNWGIGDSEFFIRKRLWQKNGFVFSAEPMIKFPSLANHSSQPQIGSRNYDTGLTFSSGYGFQAWGLDHFVDLDAGYRYRFGTPNNQLKFSAIAGFSLSKKSMVLAQVFNTSRLASSPDPTFTQSPADDYNLTKLQISTIYKMDDKLSLQIGAFSDIYGRNTGAGDGATFAISKKF